MAGDALTIISETFYEASLVNFRPSLVAAAVLYLSRKAVGSSPFWPQALIKLTSIPPPPPPPQILWTLPSGTILTPSLVSVIPGPIHLHVTTAPCQTRPLPAASISSAS